MKINKDMAEFYGVLMGDGCISRYKNQNKIVYAIRIDGNSLTDKEYYLYLQKLIYKIIERKTKIKYRKNCNGIYLYFVCKNLAEFLNKYLNFPYGKKGEIKIHNRIVNNKNLLKYTLKGFFDTDGSLYFTKNNSKIRNYPIIELSTHSKSLMYQLKEILDNFGFNTKLSHYKDSVKLHGKHNLQKWMELIGSNNYHKFYRFLYWKKYKVGLAGFEPATFSQV